MDLHLLRVSRIWRRRWNQIHIFTRRENHSVICGSPDLPSVCRSAGSLFAKMCSIHCFVCNPDRFDTSPRATRHKRTGHSSLFKLLGRTTTFRN